MPVLHPFPPGARKQPGPNLAHGPVSRSALLASKRLKQSAGLAGDIACST